MFKETCKHDIMLFLWFLTKGGSCPPLFLLINFDTVESCYQHCIIKPKT